MEQAKALSALEPFLALTSSAASPRAAADLVVRATSAPNTYIFTELLETPQIQALASSPEFAQFLTVLQIFSYGTYESYKSTAGLPELTDAQKSKLRQLSLLTIASQKNDPSVANTEPALSYASLQKALGLPSRQALEELVISAIYAGLIKAQLNPKDSAVQINSVSALRDVAPTATSGLLSSLRAWSERCDATLNSLSAQMVQLRADADRRATQSAEWAAKTEELMEDEKKGGGGGGSGSGKGLSSFSSSFSSSPTQHHKTAYRPASARKDRPADPFFSISRYNSDQLSAPHMNSSNSILTNSRPSSFGNDVHAAHVNFHGGPFSGPPRGDPEILSSLMSATQAVKRDSGQMDAGDNENDHKKANYGSKTTTLSQQTNELDLSDDPSTDQEQIK
ncbi:hypothetical protein QBC44DRAFT_372491 [Cladorrhinum sp. PSN332]|nr:hypothetical protein QBC44DRAFT_372491 [Cladorrhinum sp. PSN332]